MPDRPISVVLADDHELVRSGLGLVLDAQEDIAVVAVASDAAGALGAVLGHRPDVLVMELTMPGLPSTLGALALVRGRCATTATVVLSRLRAPVHARRALRAGAAGYVRKDGARDELVDAVRRAAADRVLPAAAVPGRETGPSDGLSPREVEVLRLIALGHTNPEIAVRLFLSLRTVESHRAHIQRKLGRTSRAELVRHALDRDLVR